MPSFRPPRFQMTIGHMMVATFICALGIAPVALALRSPDPNMMVAAVAFDLIMLPVIVALIVMSFMPPGQPRNLVIAGLCSTPILLILLGYLIALLATPILWLWFMIVEPIRSRPPAFVMIAPTAVIVIMWNQYRSFRARRCPRCGGGTFQNESKIDTIRRFVFPVLRCEGCGSRSRMVAGWLGKYRLDLVDEADCHRAEGERSP